RMVRQNRRKGIEEVYGTKLEPMQTGRPQTIPQPGMTKTAAMRCTSSRQPDARTQRSYVTANDYYITTNLPLNATNMRTASNAVMAHPSKTSQMPSGQAQTSVAQAMPYGSISNRRGKPSARQAMQNQQKVHFVATDGKGHTYPHGHSHANGKQVGKQMTQRNTFVQEMDMDPNLVELSEKDVISVSNLTMRRPHPLQHQLHQQQQQLIHPMNSNNHVHQHQKMQHQPQHQRQRGGHLQQRELPMVTEEEDKDEDPEEFFELIRQTVKTAVGTTICDVVSRNFRDLSSKMERFSNELKMTNENLGKLQNEVTSSKLTPFRFMSSALTNPFTEVMRYGEENTRHFRYLCMKSEYDKMFYQHQTMITNKQPGSKVPTTSQVNLNTMPVSTRVAKQAAVFNQKSVKQQLVSGKLAQGGNLKKVPKECVKSQNPCVCRSTSKAPAQQQQLQIQPQNDEPQSSSEQSVNVKSSNLGVREVIGQIQRFCTQMQLSDLKDEQPKYNSLTGIPQMEMSTKQSSGSGTIPGDAAGNATSLKSHISSVTASADAELETPIDSMDEIEIDNFQYSSDELSSYSDDSDVKFNGSITARAPLNSSRPKIPTQHSHKGAGDGQ
ncbi:hypothetical protein KR222_003255, partial [Zaprionus bogoriensis]